MTSAVSICSNALLELGAAPISSFNESNDRTRLVSNLYAQKRDRVLRLNDWKCCKRRVVLSPDATAPAFEWSYRFALPGDWIRTLSVGEADDDQDDYEEESGYILMDRNICYLRYVFRNEDESTWDSLLIDAMTKVMVAVLTYPITKSTTKQQTDVQIVQQVLAEARAIDASDEPPPTLGDFPLLANRWR